MSAVNLLMSYILNPSGQTWLLLAFSDGNEEDALRMFEEDTVDQQLVMELCLESHWLALSMKGWLCWPWACLVPCLFSLLAVHWHLRQPFGKSPVPQ